MVDSTDFEAFYEQERAKAARVLPPSSSYGTATVPSRHLFFARDEDNMQSVSPRDSESTLQGDAIVPQQIAFVGNRRGGTRNEEGVVTLGVNPNTINVGSAHKMIMSRGVNSAHSGDEHSSKQTFFESPYWPGSQPFRSRGLQESNSSAQKSAGGQFTSLAHKTSEGH